MKAKQMVSQVPARQEIWPGADLGSSKWVRWGSGEERCWANPCLQPGSRCGWRSDDGVGTEMTHEDDEQIIRTGSSEDVLQTGR